jgi:hypothetical protein
VGLERGPLSLATTTEELLGRKSSGSGLENREYSRRYPSRWPRGTLYPQKLAITSPTSGGRSVGIVRSRTQKLCWDWLWTITEVPKILLSTLSWNTLSLLSSFNVRNQVSHPYWTRARTQKVLGWMVTGTI